MRHRYPHPSPMLDPFHPQGVCAPHAGRAGTCPGKLVWEKIFGGRFLGTCGGTLGTSRAGRFDPGSGLPRRMRSRFPEMSHARTSCGNSNAFSREDFSEREGSVAYLLCQLVGRQLEFCRLFQFARPFANSVRFSGGLRGGCGRKSWHI